MQTLTVFGWRSLWEGVASECFKVNESNRRDEEKSVIVVYLSDVGLDCGDCFGVWTLI